MKKPAMHVQKDRSVRWRRVIQALVSYLVAAVCLYWVFRDVEPAQLLQSMRHIRWELLGGAILLEFVAYFWVALEWQILLKPVGSLSLVQVGRAVFAGRFANDVLPVQLGYLIRAFLASRWMGANIASVFPSLIVERIWDGVWLALGISVVTFFVPLPAAVVHARNILGAVVLGGAALAIIIARIRKRSGPPAALPGHSKWKFVRSSLDVVGRLAAGLQDIGQSRLLPVIAGLAMIKLATQALAFFMIGWAYGLRLTGWTGAAVFLMSYLGICIPSTPAGAGVFQLFSVAGLRFFGIDKAAAAGFSLLAFVAITVPLAIAGAVALAQSGMTLRQLRTEVRQIERQRGPGKMEGAFRSGPVE